MVYVAQSGSNYLIHQFKNFCEGKTECNIEWEGKSTLAPNTSDVYLQIYNEVTELWETLDTSEDANDNINFELSAHINDLTDYKDGSNVVSCRVYQFASIPSILSSDYFSIVYPIVYGDSYTDKGTTYTDNYSVQGNTFTDKYEVKDTQFIRNYPPTNSEKILNK